MKEANYDDWAEALLQEIYYCPEHQRVALLCEHLLKATKRGYLDGLDNGWAYEQDDFLQRKKAVDLENLDD